MPGSAGQFFLKKNMPPNKPYHIVNFCFALIILLIFSYSAVFSPYKNNYPIPSLCEKIYGKNCKSTGLSRSFSSIVRGNFEQAKAYNSNGIRLFSFFAIQLVLRVFFSALLSKTRISARKLSWADAAVSLLLFFYCFAPFLKFWKL